MTASQGVPPPSSSAICIYLRTRLEVFSDFYALLGDFAFTINCNGGIGDQVEAVSPYRPSTCDTSMIATITHPLEPALAS